MSAAQRSANLVHESGTVYDYASCTTRTAAAELEPSHMAATGEESAHESKAASALSAVKAAAQSFGHALRSLWPF